MAPASGRVSTKRGGRREKVPGRTDGVWGRGPPGGLPRHHRGFCVGPRGRGYTNPRAPPPRRLKKVRSNGNPAGRGPQKGGRGARRILTRGRGAHSQGRAGGPEEREGDGGVRAARRGEATRAGGVGGLRRPGGRDGGAARGGAPGGGR